MDIKESHGFWKLLTILEADAEAKIPKENIIVGMYFDGLNFLADCCFLAWQQSLPCFQFFADAKCLGYDLAESMVLT